jgi:hypothetical protein
MALVSNLDAYHMLIGSSPFVNRPALVLSHLGEDFVFSNAVHSTFILDLVDSRVSKQQLARKTLLCFVHTLDLILESFKEGLSLDAQFNSSNQAARSFIFFKC